MKNLSNKSLLKLLEKHNACLPAIEWIGTRDLKTAWEECARADWLFWFAGKSKKLPRKKLVLAACGCARTALKFVPAGEKRPRIAIETAEKWCRGEATLEEVRDAAYAAAAADAAAYANAAAYAAAAVDAAAYAAYAYADADAAANAVDAAAYAAYAYADADATAARLECAKVVRSVFSYTDL